MKTYDTIIQPITTEKSSQEQARNQYTFIVAKTATKVDIKQAVKALYGVEVEGVRTMILPEKYRMIKFKHKFVKRPVTKKAIVRLKGGKTIDPNKFKESKKK
jgi:large subunit ribosomal protein L23